jgi:hypothetical protein
VRENKKRWNTQKNARHEQISNWRATTPKDNKTAWLWRNHTPCLLFFFARTSPAHTKLLHARREVRGGGERVDTGCNNNKKLATAGARSA